jgi:hypothetical protein
MGGARVVALVTKNVVAPLLIVQRILRLCRDQAGLFTGRIGACGAAHDKEVFVEGVVLDATPLREPSPCRE